MQNKRDHVKRRVWISGAKIASFIHENAKRFLLFAGHGNEKQGFFPAPRWTMIFRSAHLYYKEISARNNNTRGIKTSFALKLLSKPKKDSNLCNAVRILLLTHVAGAEGIEPSSKVLETSVLPLNQAPNCHSSVRGTE